MLLIMPTQSPAPRIGETSSWHFNTICGLRFWTIDRLQNINLPDIHDNVVLWLLLLPRIELRMELISLNLGSLPLVLYE